MLHLSKRLEGNYPKFLNLFYENHLRTRAAVYQSFKSGPENKLCSFKLQTQKQ
jgi:hypothetical protein